MNGIKHILAIIDPTSEQQPALERAVWLARRSQASLELFICDYDPLLAEEERAELVSLEHVWKAIADSHLGRLREHANRLEKAGLTVSIDVRLDHPLYLGIARKASESEADVVLKDTHYHTALRRSVFSNTDWQLIRHCPAPLWLVKPREMPAQPRILAAVDPLHAYDKPAALDHAILSAAIKVRDMIDGRLEVFHSYDIAPALAVSGDSMTMPIAIPVQELAEALKDSHTSAMLKLVGEFKLPRESVHILQGNTRQLLVSLTEQMNSDLVVMGAVSRRGLKRLFIGNTAEQVLDRLPCDLLIIKTEGQTKA